VVFTVRIQRRESRKLLTNGQRPLLFQGEVFLHIIYFKFCHRVNNRCKYTDGFYHSTINDKDSSKPSPLIMFTCTVLRYALLEWQMNKGVYLKADRPDRSNYFNYKHDGGQQASCCAALGHKL